MMEKILTMLVGLLIALGGWSLSRTFEPGHTSVSLRRKTKFLQH
jgi:hypothetical protein